MSVHFAIVGLPRSGTTFLASYFSQFDKVYVCPELFWFFNYDLKGLDYTLNDVVFNRLTQDKELVYHYEDIINLPFSRNNSSIDLKILLDYLSSINDFHFIGLNTPSNYYHTDKLLDNGFRVVFVTRKLAEISSSYMSVSWVRNGYVVPLIRYPRFRKHIEKFKSDTYIIDFGRFTVEEDLLDCVKHVCKEIAVLRKIKGMRRLVKTDDKWSVGHFDRSSRAFDRSLHTWRISKLERYVADIWEGVFISGKWLNWRLIYLLNPIVIIVLLYHLLRNSITNVAN